MSNRAGKGAIIKLYNSMIRDIEELVPRQKGQVKIFTCGPSTYRRPHIGNYRTFLYEDILERYLEYLGYSIERILVFTDVEDKTIDEAVRKRKTIRTITEEVARQFYADAEKLHLRIPDTIPRATTSVETAVSIIQELVRKGHAYEDVIDSGFSPQDLRFFLSSAEHYRNKLNYTKAGMKEASVKLTDCRRRVGSLENLTNDGDRKSSLMTDLSHKLSRDFEAHMDDDLSVGKAFDSIVKNLKDIERFSPDHPVGKDQADDITDKLAKIDTVMGLFY